MLGVPEFLGHPLIVGDEMYALAASDLFFRWQPNVSANIMRVHHPLPEVELDLSPAAQFGGYPPALAPTGIVSADDATHRFLTVLMGQNMQRWHQDVSYSLGIPSVLEGVIYTSVGGSAADKGIMAIDSDTASPVWSYAPKKLVPDREVLKPYAAPKFYKEPIIEEDNVTLKNGSKRVRITGYETRQTTVKVPQPVSTAPFAHWSNSGLVVMKDRVYAEVDHTLVALDRKDGTVVWSLPLHPDEIIRSLVATPDHLVFVVSDLGGTRRAPTWDPKSAKIRENRIVAVKIEDGKEEWSQKMARPGNLALAGGLLFYTDGELHVLGPSKETQDAQSAQSGSQNDRK